MTRVLVVTVDTIGPRMAGPAIRATNIAEVLGARHEVRLATTGAVDPAAGGTVVAEAVDGARLLELARWAEVVVFQGWVLAQYPALADQGVLLVADIYDPMHLEQLEQGRDAGPERHRDAVADSAAALNQQLLQADFLLCASERQRDFWLGQLAGLGRVNPSTYADDPRLRTLIDVAPFGLPATPPEAEAVDATDELRILWGGGVYNWFDPLTLLHAMDRLRHELPNVRLDFLGMAHPSPDVPTMQRAVETRSLSDELGLTGSVVRFNDGWVPYAERGRHLRAAHVGVSSHLDHVETRFAFRTRLLDYLWARLPIVTTSGDVLADLVAAEDLGIVVPPGDAVALADALHLALTDADRRSTWAANADRVAPRYEWATVLEPLVRYCDAPRPAADLRDPAQRRRLDPGSSPLPRDGWRAEVQRAGRRVRSEGIGGLARGIAGRVERNRGKG